MRADPKGDLGKPRSGIPYFPFGVRGRRRAISPGRAANLPCVCAGAEVGAQGWRTARLRSCVGRCKRAVLSISARGASVSGWGWGGGWGSRYLRDSGPPHTSPEFLSKSGKRVYARLQQGGTSCPEDLSPGRRFLQGCSETGYPFFCQVPRPGPLQLLLLDPNPWRDLGSPGPALPAAPPYVVLFTGSGARLRVDFHAGHHRLEERQVSRGWDTRCAGQQQQKGTGKCQIASWRCNQYLLTSRAEVTFGHFAWGCACPLTGLQTSQKPVRKSRVWPSTDCFSPNGRPT